MAEVRNRSGHLRIVEVRKLFIPTRCPAKGVKESSGAQAAPEKVGHPRLCHSPRALPAAAGRPGLLGTARRWSAGQPE